MDGENYSMVLTTAVGGRDRDHHPEDAEESFPRNVITVRKDVEISD